MSKPYDQHLVDKECQKSVEIHLARKPTKSISNTNELSYSYDNISRPPLKHSTSVISRDDSVSSRGSFSSLFPSILRSFDSSSGVTYCHNYVPRPQKTIKLFATVIKVLRDLYHQYSGLTYEGDVLENSERGEMGTKVDQRIMLLEALKSDYEAMIIEKEVILNEIALSFESVMSSTTGKKDFDMIDCENYCTVCREMCIIEAKLERCCGKLQFQIMELDSVSRVSPFDQYELSIRLSEGLKFKTRIKVEKNGHQIWDNTTFTLNPSVDDTLDVKFAELKTLNKSMIILEKKVPLLNNLILPEPNIYTCWLTPVGTIKLRMIVQWNAILDDPDLNLSLHQIDIKHYDNATKDGTVMRKRLNSDTTKNSSIRSSLTFSGMFRFDATDKTSNSMGNIDEHIDEEDTPNVNIRKAQISRSSYKTRAEYRDDLYEEVVATDRPSSDKISNCSLNRDNLGHNYEYDANLPYNDDDVSKTNVQEMKLCDYNLANTIENETVVVYSNEECSCDTENTPKEDSINIEARGIHEKEKKRNTCDNCDLGDMLSREPYDNTPTMVIDTGMQRCDPSIGKDEVEYDQNQNNDIIIDNVEVLEAQESYNQLTMQSFEVVLDEEKVFQDCSQDSSLVNEYIDMVVHHSYEANDSGNKDMRGTHNCFTIIDADQRLIISTIVDLESGIKEKLPYNDEIKEPSPDIPALPICQHQF